MQVIEKAREYIGTPFHHQGRQKGVGIDCAGLVWCVARDLGIPLTDRQGYGRTPYRGLLQQALDSELERIEKPEPGCVLLMKFAHEPSHVAICTGKTLIHAYERVGQCIEHDYDKTWQRLTVAAYRFKS